MRYVKKISHKRFRLACICLFLTVLLSGAAWCQFPGMIYTPVKPGNSSDLAGRIERGEMVFMPYHGVTLWAADQLFTSFAGLKVQSDNGFYNIVIPKDSKTDELSTLTDTDFIVFGETYMPLTAGTVENYGFTFTGDPVNPRPFVTSLNGFAPYKPISRDYYNVAPGAYIINCQVQDAGKVLLEGSGSTADSACSFLYNLYIPVFVSQSRILPSNNSAVPVSMEYTPATLPNSANLSIRVEWDGTDSDLYEDSACQTMITGTGNIKTWSVAGAPSVIYYKKATPGINAQQFTITLVATVNNENVVLAKKELQANGSFIITAVEGGRTDDEDLMGFWTSSYSVYPHPEWQDNSNPADGEAYDIPGTTSADINRPLLYRINDNFVIHSVSISHGDGITYSSNDYYLQAVSNDGMLNAYADSFTDSSGVITGSDFRGSSFSAVNCKDVTINWKLISRSGGQNISIGQTKHKIYVIRGTVTKPYHTYADFGCSAARGLSSEESVKNAIWEKLSNLSVKREDGGSEFTYWGSQVSVLPEQDWYFTAEGLIAHRDGRCEAWARFVNELFLVQGITSQLVGLEVHDYDGYNDQNEYVSIMLAASGKIS